MMTNHSFYARVFAFIKRRFHEFWSEDTAPRMPKRSKERDK